MISADKAAIVGGAGGGGGGGDAPRPAKIAGDTLQSVAIIEFIDGICEGEIEGFATVDPLQSIFLNDTPVVSPQTGDLNFDGVTIDYRTGTQDQTYIPGQEELTSESASSAALEIDVGAMIEVGDPAVRTIASNVADALKITLRTGALNKRDPKTGDVSGTSVTVSVTVETLSTGSPVVVDFGGKNTIQGKSSSAYERALYINLEPYGDGPYTVTLTRVTPTSDDDTNDDVSWKTYGVITHGKLRYPNTALARLTFDARHFTTAPKRGYLIKGAKVKVPGPAFYDPVARTYTGVDWDGTFVTAWTRCPAWIFYDMVTDQRYGLGSNVDESYVDKWSLWSIAKRCDFKIQDGFGGVEPRYSLDLYLQQDHDAKKIIQDIASNFDTMAFWHGGGLFVSQDAPKSLVALYTPANVIGGRFAYVGSARQVRHTVALVQWNDPADFYKIATEYVEDPDGIERYGYREVKTVAIGCTSRGQAHRHGKRLLLTSRLETDVANFSVGMSGMVDKPGNIIAIADPLKTNPATGGDMRLGGRVKEGSTSTVILLDGDVELLNGLTYSLSVLNPGGQDTIRNDGSHYVSEPTVVVGNVTTTPGVAVSSITVSPALSITPSAESTWTLHVDSSIPKREYRILMISESKSDSDEGMYDISAVRYDPDKYTQAESIGELEPIYKAPYANTAAVYPPSNIIFNEGVYLGIEGAVRFLDISWDSSPDRLLSHYNVAWTLNEGDLNDGPATGSSYRIDNAREGEYQVTVAAVNIAGFTSTSVTIQYTLGALYQVSLISITDLTIKDTAGVEFTGRDAEFTWGTDADTILDYSDSFGVGDGGQTPWFRDFRVRVYTDAGATLLRTEYVTEAKYRYSLEMNANDNAGSPNRDVMVDVVARDFYGNLSMLSTLSVTNPPPQTFSSIDLTGGAGVMFVEYYPPTDPDYKYTRVFASQTSGFTPDPTPVTGNMVYEGSDRVMSFPAVVGTWYVVLQGVDEFGLSGTVYSSEVTEATVSADITAEVDAILADPGRSGDVVVEADRFIIVQPSTYVTPTAVFAVGMVDGVATVGIRGDLLVDGSINTQSVAADAITANEIKVTTLSSISHDSGLITAGTFRTSPLESGWRTEISDIGGYPIWYGTGVKNDANAVFYLNDAGSAMFKGELNAADGEFVVDVNGHVTMKSVTIQDAVGNVLFSVATGMEWGYLNNRPSDNQLLNSNTVWSEINDDGDMPADNADVTADQISGSGINILNAEYTVLESTLPTYGTKETTTTESLDDTIAYFGTKSLKISATGANAWLFLAASDTDYNIVMTPQKRWIVSIYVRCSAASVQGQFFMKTSATGTLTSPNTFMTSPTPNTWVRVYGVIDLLADPSTAGVFRIDNDGGAGIDMWFDGMMMEEQVGNVALPSAYSLPAGAGGASGVTDYAELTGLPTTLGDISSQESADLISAVKDGNPITSGNVTTYISSAAIGAAEIGSIALIGTNNFSVKTSGILTDGRIEMDSRAIKVYDTGGTLRVHLGDLSA